ncbi:MAG: rhodanese-like domain-containing protein [Chthonomonadales bacterium]
MYFQPYYLGCLAHASYLIGGDNGEAAVIDPRRDVDEYIADATAAGLKIKYVIETHLHADFVSGHLELARKAGATICLGAQAEAEFEHTAITEDLVLNMGDVTLKFLETPGHTPEGITILVYSGPAVKPKIAFTGDTLFIGDVGRPDLAGGRGFTPEQMARMMYQSLSKKILSLPDETEVWPAHGAGSSCGKALSDDRVSTIGKERATNPALQFVVNQDEEGFVNYSTEGLGNSPGYFAFDAEKNRRGAMGVDEIIAQAKPLAPAEVEELMEDILVLDTRSAISFAAGHIPGAIHVQLEGKFAPWVGTVLSPEYPLIVVADDGAQDETITRLARIGYEMIAGWLNGGMAAWVEAGGEVAHFPFVAPSEAHRLLEAGTCPQVLDVRSPAEFDSGHIDHALSIPLPELEKRLSDVPKGDLLVVCGSGYRSSIACSILQRAGRNDITNMSGGMAEYSH